MKDPASNTELVSVEELGRPCTFQLIGPFAGSTAVWCDKSPATSGVVDPETEKVHLRCEDHRGLLQDLERHEKSGEVVSNLAMNQKTY